MNIKERPIILNEKEVNAVLEGSKTQHRMIVNVEDSIVLTFTSLEAGASPERIDGLPFGCPFGDIGDRLWVQEDFIPDPPADHDAWEDDDSVTSYFQWDGCGSKLSEIPKRLRKPEHVIYKASWQDPESMVWLSASQMRKWASRLLLEITGVWIQRVQDITHNDSVKEAAFTFYPKQAVPPLSAFPRYWMEKYGDDAWRLNPWVWVIEFKVVEPSEVGL